MQEFLSFPATRQARLVREGSISPVELVRAHLGIDKSVLKDIATRKTPIVTLILL